jgi:hypothetical protein
VRSGLRAGVIVALLATCAHADTAPGTAAPGRSASPSEYEVKAAFLFHFASYVEWPPEGLPPADQPFVVGVLGEGPLAGAVESTLRGKSSLGRPLTVRRLARAEDALHVQVLVVEDSMRDELGAVLRVLGDAPVLTVADLPRFAESGGMIEFVVRDRRVRFEVNLPRAQKAGLKLSSQLLKLATIVGSE